MLVYATDETNWKRASLEGRQSARMRASWTFVEGQIGQLTDLANRKHFALTILIIPMFEQMLSDDYRNARYQSELTRIAHGLEVDVVDPLPAIRASKPSYPRSF